jgi:5-methylcytosine-specific restriction endonuclease McrA
MNIVSPSTRTTLLLNRTYQFDGFLSARAAIRHLITGKVLAIDANGNTFEFDKFHTEAQYFENSPVLRSVHDDWTVPTIVVSQRSFGYRKRQPISSDNKFASVRRIYNHYKGICQYCHEKIRLDQASRDHVIPRAIGGTNHDINLVLSCIPCNNLKDKYYPYFDKNGKEVKAKPIASFLPNTDGIVHHRPEWDLYMFRS